MRRRVPPILPLLIVVAAYRLSLLGRGAMAFLDETLYYKAALALQQLRLGDLLGALAQMAASNGRPGDTVLKLIPAALQGIPFAFGVSPSNPWSLMIPTVCNVLVSLVTLYLFFRICLILFAGDQIVSITASIVYSLLVNSNLYVRHILPYDWALCVGVYALWLALSRPSTSALAWRIGLLAGSVVTIYPGFYLFAGIPGVVLFGRNASTGTTQRWRMAAGFVAGVVTVIAVFEILCRFGGKSYIATARALSRTITQGSFEEGWTFLPRYLIDVERYAGAAFLIGIVVYFARTASEIARGTYPRQIHWLVFPAVAGWIWQAAGAYHGHTMVLYGRLIHPWMMFLVWALADSVTWARPRVVRSALCLVAVIAAAVSLGRPAYDYYRLAYPADVLYELGIDMAQVPTGNARCEMRPVYAYTSPAPLNRETGHPYRKTASVFLINFCQGLPQPGRPTPAPASPDARPIYAAPHFMTFPAYGFEGLAPDDRREIRRMGYQVQVYETGGDR